MVKNIKKLWLLRWDEGLLHVGLLGLGLLAGIIIDLLLRSDVTENESGVIFFIGSFIMFLDFGFFQHRNFSHQAKLALQFSIPRKKLLSANALMDVLFLAADYILLLTVCAIERLILVGTGSFFVLDQLMVSPAVGFLCIFCFMLCIYFWLQALVGNGLMRFGKVAFWIAYFVYFGSMIVIPKMQSAGVLSNNTLVQTVITSLLKGFTGVSITLIPFLLVLTAIAILVDFLLFRKQAA